MRLSLKHFLASCIILISSVSGVAVGEDAPKSGDWYKTPLLSQTLDLPGQNATDTKQPIEAQEQQAQVTPVPPVVDAPSIQVPQTVIEESKPADLPAKREIKLTKSKSNAIYASEVRRGQSNDVQLEPSSAPPFTTRVSKAQPEKPWYTNFYVRADYGIQQVRTTGLMQYGLIKTGFKRHSMFGGGIGYKCNDFIRLDLNFSSGSINPKIPLIKKASRRSIYLNAHFHLMNSGYLIPYLTAGVGRARTKFQNKDFGFYTTPAGDAISGSVAGSNIRTSVINLGAGVLIAAIPNVKIDLSYKYSNSGKFTLPINYSIKGEASPRSGNLKGRLRSNQFVGGIILNL